MDQPLILLLDEPLSALDYKLRKEMHLELGQLHRKLGITFVFVTHDQEAAHRFIDFILKPEMAKLICERYWERLKTGF